ncbi:MAG: hypothetical protein V2I67_01075 [Thermoanaerobaculales bacterium]|jgi:hypothetical protein|nr:hypothetical protein [Thermoanaerobaculales bacterium]
MSFRRKTEKDGRSPRFRALVSGLVANVLFSWIIIGFVIPPWRLYSLRELAEVFFWQLVGIVGWPLALFGSAASLVFQPGAAGLSVFLMIFVYPSMLVLFFVFLRTGRHWALVLLHILLTASFAGIWYHVVNGYDFMVG